MLSIFSTRGVLTHVNKVRMYLDHKRTARDRSIWSIPLPGLYQTTIDEIVSVLHRSEIASEYYTSIANNVLDNQNELDSDPAMYILGFLVSEFRFPDETMRLALQILEYP